MTLKRAAHKYEYGFHQVVGSVLHFLNKSDPLKTNERASFIFNDYSLSIIANNSTNWTDLIMTGFKSVYYHDTRTQKIRKLLRVDVRDVGDFLCKMMLFANKFCGLDCISVKSVVLTIVAFGCDCLL